MENKVQEVLKSIGNLEDILENYSAFQYNDKVFMTGEEWYRRFVDALDNEFHFMTKPINIDSSVYYDAPNVMKAAKKASGL
jgi:hypothetical protein